MNLVYRFLSWLLGLVCPKNPKLIVFGSKHFGGNAAPVLERIREIEMEGVWLTTRPEILALGRSDVCPANSFKGVWHAARASAVVITHTLKDLWPLRFPSSRAKIYNLWHGMPIKRVSRAAPGFRYRAHAKAITREIKRYRMMFVSSKQMADVFARTFGHPLERILITGQPRTDALLEGLPPDLNRIYDPPLPRHSHRILYCPTWRDREAVKLFPFRERDLKAIDEFLARRDALIFIRTHPDDRARFNKRKGRLIPMQMDLIPEVTNTLPLFDVLITDYSSVYYDYILLDRPVIFLPYDYEKYSTSPGFSLPYEYVTAGPTPRTQEEFLAALATALDDPASSADERFRVREIAYAHLDALATARVLDFLARDLSPELFPQTPLHRPGDDSQ